MQKARFTRSDRQRLNQRSPVTAARPQTRASRSSGAITSGNVQTEQFIRQSPEPFRNPKGEIRLPAPTNTRAKHPYGSPSPTLKPGSFRRAQPSSQPMSLMQILRATGEPRKPRGYTAASGGNVMRDHRDVIGNSASQSSARAPQGLKVGQRVTAAMRKEYPGVLGRGY
jgi:hypothetical protein